MHCLVRLIAMLAATITMTVAAAGEPVSPAPATPASTAAKGSASAPAAASSAPIPAARNGSAPALTHADLETFLDGLVPFALDRGDVAGGVIVVVKDGKVLLAKGYGYADLKARTRPSPATTLFRPGSVSKLVTWTALMQLVEQGKVELDAPVSRYLDFKIPPAFGEPITVRNLMTHTPGFEDTARGLMPTDPDEVDLGHYLKTHIPERIFPPGEVVAYSNYGAGLAGYIVQRVSGQPFADYVREHIFEPLGMHHSSFKQPLPPRLAEHMAEGYKSASDGQPQAFELVNPAPAGGMSATALDMAKFMIAQLQNGRYQGHRILRAETARLMHSPQHTAVPGMNGFALGFYQGNRNGLRIIGHAGDTNYFHSDLHLLLDKGVGIYMSFNSSGNRGGAHVIRRAIFDAFLDRYFPHHEEAKPTVDSARADAARVTGWYQSSRRNESALDMLYLLGQVEVTATPEGELVIPMLTDPAGTPLHWRDIGSLQYQQLHGQARVAFVTDDSGAVKYWATDLLPPVAVFQRVPAMYSLGVVKPLLSLVLLATLAALLIWLCGAWLRRHYGHALDLNRGQRRVRLGSRVGALALLLTLLGWLVFLAYTSSHLTQLLNGALVPGLYALYALGVLGLLGALAMLVNAVRVWLAPRRGRWVLAGETLLALAALYAIWFILAFGLVSFNVQY